MGTMEIDKYKSYKTHDLIKKNNYKLPGFYIATKTKLKKFSKKSFFSDFIILEKEIKQNLNLLISDLSNISANQKCKFYRKINILINKRKKQLLDFWAIDVINGFKLLQQANAKKKINAIDIKFATNHHKHAEDVVANLEQHPSIGNDFFQTIIQQLKPEESMTGLENIRKKLLESLESTVSPMDDPKNKIDRMKELFSQAVLYKKRMLNKTLKKPTSGAQAPSMIFSEGQTKPKVKDPDLTADPCYRLRKVADKTSESISENIEAIRPEIRLESEFASDDFNVLKKRIDARIAKYSSPQSPKPLPTSAVEPPKMTPQYKQQAILQDKQEIAARKIYQGASTVAPEVTDSSAPALSPVTQFSMQNANKEKMFDVKLLEDSKGVSLTFADKNPNSSAIVAGAEIMKDAEEIARMKNKEVKGLVIRDYEDDLVAGLAIYCSLASQENEVVFAGELLNSPNEDNVGAYEVALFLQGLWKTKEGKDQLLHLVKDGNDTLQRMVDFAKKDINMHQDLSNRTAYSEKLTKDFYKEFFNSSDPPLIPPPKRPPSNTASAA